MESTQNSGTHYLRLVLRYWLVVVIFVVLTAAASFFFRNRQPALYQSSVKIFVGNALSAPDPEVSNFQAAERLALTYAELVRSFDFLQSATRTIDPDIDVDFLTELVSVEVVSDTSILVVSVRDTDADKAAELANGIAAGLIDATPSTLSEEQQQQLNRIRGQIESLETLIVVTQDQHQEAINAINESGNSDPEQSAVAAQLTDQLNSSYASLALLENEYRNLSNRISRIDVIDPARPNYESLGMSAIVVAVAGAFLGIVIAVSGVIVLDIFDTTLRTEDEIKSQLDIPVIGSINRNNWSREHLRDLLQSGQLLTSQVNAQYRAALSNILFSAEQDQMHGQKHRLIIVSPQRANGRSFSAINLAVAASDAGLKTLLVDADGQNPSIHDYFNLDNDKYALSQLLDYLLYNEDVLDDDKQIVELHNKVIRTFEPIERLFIIPSGRPATQQKRSIPRLQSLRDFLDRAQTLLDYDIIIMDTPANETSLDAVNLVAVTRAKALMILQKKGTSRGVAEKTIEDFRRIGYDIDGVIIN